MRLDQIEHATSNLPQHREVLALEDEARTLDTQLVNSRTALSDVQREVDKSEADVQLVRDRAARDRARLDAGTGTAKDLQALQHELTSLSRRQSELEDIELEIMERAEALAEHVPSSSATSVTSRPGWPRSSRRGTSRWATTRVSATPSPAAGPPPSSRWGRTLSRCTSGSARATPASAPPSCVSGACGGCHMELNQVDMNRITQAPADEVLRCEECGRILVRTAESGLPAT